jgi:SSS family solute:Na+ symporter
LRPREVDYVQNYTEQVDITPWKPVKMYGIIITIIVISTYFIFT